jgi:hypothetical protein
MLSHSVYIRIGLFMSVSHHLKPNTNPNPNTNAHRDPEIGLREARRHGFVLIEFTFDNVTKNLCESVGFTFSEMNRFENITGMRTVPTKCKPKIGHTDTSHRTKSMEGRIGQTASRNIREWFKGTWAEWMLDLHAVNPPR